MRRSAAGRRCRRAGRAPRRRGRRRAPRARAGRRRPRPGRRESSRRRSRSPAAAADPRASRPRPCRRGRSRSRSSRCPRRTPRGCTPARRTRRARRGGGGRGRRALSIRKTPRWPPESAGFSTAGKPTVLSARLPSPSERTAANGGCGTPSSAKARRITILFRIRCATAVPIVGSPSRSVTAATTGTARSAETVSAPSTAWRRATSVTASTSVKSTASPTSATCSPSASGLRSTATTRRPCSRACRIARRWWRPAPTKRTVFTPGDASQDLRGSGSGRARCRRGSRKPTRCHRAISQPLSRRSRDPDPAAEVGARHPGRATARPQISVHAVSGGVGRNALVPERAQAAARRGRPRHGPRRRGRRSGA